MPSFLKKSSSGNNFSRGTLNCAAARSRISSIVFCWVGIGCSLSWQIRLRVGALHKLFQCGFDGWSRIQIANNLNLAPQLIIRNRFSKLLGGSSGMTVELAKLRSGHTRNSQRFAFCDDLADQPSLLGFCGVKTPPSKHEVAHHRVPQIPLQPGNSAKAGDQPQPQFREAEA